MPFFLLLWPNVDENLEIEITHIERKRRKILYKSPESIIIGICYLRYHSLNSLLAFTKSSNHPFPRKVINKSSGVAILIKPNFRIFDMDHQKWMVQK